MEMNAATPENPPSQTITTLMSAIEQAPVLVVDDSRTMRLALTRELNKLGFTRITEAADGQVALDLLAQRDFDLIVLDIEMPRVNGFEVLAALKRDPARRHLPVIVASGLDRLDAVVRCIELGAEDFLPKPVNAVLLGARVGASLERKRLRDLERLRRQRRRHGIDRRRTAGAHRHASACRLESRQPRATQRPPPRRNRPPLRRGRRPRTTAAPPAWSAGRRSPGGWTRPDRKSVV